MKSKIFKTILPICLAIILSVAPASLSLATKGDTATDSAVTASGNAQIKGKDEVIYAVLASDGNVRSIYAVNHFTIIEAGSITDYGDYTSVKNLTDTTPIRQSGHAVTVQTNAENFYYQGNMANTELPWIFETSYCLDGVKIEPQELAGRSGKIEIHITTKENTAVNPTFYENYMLQISIGLDTDKSSDIKAPGATIANAGKNKIVTYTVMPGMDADISLSAMARDFAMIGIDISALPFSMDMDLPNTDSMISDFTELSDAISGLNDGVGDLADGLAELKTGSGELTNGSSHIKAGLSQLSDNSDQLLQASSQVGGALTQVARSLDGASGEMDLDDLTQLPQGLSLLAHGLGGISGGLIELENGFALAYSALDDAIQGIPDAAVSQEQIGDLYIQTDSSQHDLLDQLVAAYTAGQTVKGTYDHTREAFDAVGSTIDLLSASIDTISAALDDMSDKISDALSNMDIIQQLAQLSAGLAELDENYTVFHRGLKDYMDGIGELSSGHGDFHNGLSTFRDGVGNLYDGVVEMHDGTTELSDETTKIPDTIQSEIDDMLDQYTGSDFEPISFTSPKNEATDLVQFVLTCDGIEKPEEPKGVEDEPSNLTFWDRLIALFRGKKED